MPAVSDDGVYCMGGGVWARVLDVDPPPPRLPPPPSLEIGLESAGPWALKAP